MVLMILLRSVSRGITQHIMINHDFRPRLTKGLTNPLTDKGLTKSIIHHYPKMVFLR